MYKMILQYMTTLLITLLSLNSMQSQSKSIPSLETISIKSHVFERPINVLYQSGTTDQVVYITDGQKMIDNGAWAVIDSLIQENRKLDATYVFISTIDDVSGEDYREEYFFCNSDNKTFLELELLPEIEQIIGKKYTADQRSLVGVSFGALNATYMLQSDQFLNYGILSPITYPCPDIISKIAFTDISEKRIFFSTGKNDAEAYLQPLRLFTENKVKDIKVLTTDGAHDFQNWNGQIQMLVPFLLNVNNQ